MARGKIDSDQIDWNEAIGEPVTINNTLTVSGSVSVDEYIYHNGDADTFIKLTDNGILLKAGGMSMFKTSGSVGQILVNNGGHDLDFIVKDATSGSLLYTDAENARVGIGTSSPEYELHVAGDIGVDHYIRHNGDGNTHINFTDDKIVLKAGNKAMITMEEKGTAPHEITLNDGANNIDFVIKGNGSNAGNPGMFFDASNNRVGINGVGNPSYELDVAGDIGISEYIYHKSDADTYMGFPGQNQINLVANGYSFLKYDGVIKINEASRDRDTQIIAEDGNVALHIDAADNTVGIGTQSPATELHINGALTLTEKSSDPADPAEGQSVLWMSDGTGHGDDGDIIIKITAGGNTKTVILVDYSAHP